MTSTSAPTPTDDVIDQVAQAMYAKFHQLAVDLHHDSSAYEAMEWGVDDVVTRFWRDVARAGLVALPSEPDDERHIIEFRENGWTIKHPLSCRPRLFECPVNRAAEDQLTEPPAELGRFVADLNDGRLVVGVSVDEGAPRVVIHASDLEMPVRCNGCGEQVELNDTYACSANDDLRCSPCYFDWRNEQAEAEEGDA